MAVPSTSSKLWWHVRGRLLERVSNNIDSASNRFLNGFGSFSCRRLLGTQWRNIGTQWLYFRTQNQNPVQKNKTHEASSQYFCRLVQCRITTESVKSFAESSNGQVAPEEEVENQNSEGSDTDPPSMQEGQISSVIVTEAQNKIHVSNLSRSVNTKALHELFRQYGNVLEAKVIFDSKAGRVYGFITYSSATEAESAVASLHRKEFCNRKLVVKKARVENQT